MVCFITFRPYTIYMLSCCYDLRLHSGGVIYHRHCVIYHNNIGLNQYKNIHIQNLYLNRYPGLIPMPASAKLRILIIYACSSRQFRKNYSNSCFHPIHYANFSLRIYGCSIFSFKVIEQAEKSPENKELSAMALTTGGSPDSTGSSPCGCSPVFTLLCDISVPFCCSYPKIK